MIKSCTNRYKSTHTNKLTVVIIPIQANSAENPWLNPHDTTRGLMFSWCFLATYINAHPYIWKCFYHCATLHLPFHSIPMQPLYISTVTLSLSLQLSLIPILSNFTLFSLSIHLSHIHTRTRIYTYTHTHTHTHTYTNIHTVLKSLWLLIVSIPLECIATCVHWQHSSLLRSSCMNCKQGSQYNKTMFV